MEMVKAASQVPEKFYVYTNLVYSLIFRIFF